jgi:hypothetical protein
MSFEYSELERAGDKWSLPDIEVFELTAREAAEINEDLIWDYTKRREFRLALMNTKTRDAMFDAMIEEESIEGGWFWRACFPGCLPEGDPSGPFKTYREALKDARATNATD